MLKTQRQKRRLGPTKLGAKVHCVPLPRCIFRLLHINKVDGYKKNKIINKKETCGRARKNNIVPHGVVPEKGILGVLTECPDAHALAVQCNEARSKLGGTDGPGPRRNPHKGKTCKEKVDGRVECRKPYVRSLPPAGLAERCDVTLIAENTLCKKSELHGRPRKQGACEGEPLFAEVHPPPHEHGSEGGKGIKEIGVSPVSPLGGLEGFSQESPRGHQLAHLPRLLRMQYGPGYARITNPVLFMHRGAVEQVDISISSHPSLYCDNDRLGYHRQDPAHPAPQSRRQDSF